MFIAPNDKNNVIGGYTSEGFAGSEYDENAFLLMVRTKVKIFDLKEGKRAIIHDVESGPTFGEGGDLWCNYYGSNSNNGCLSSSFEFDGHEFSGCETKDNMGLYNFYLREYEVFEIAIM